MSKDIHSWLNEYAKSHQNNTNKAIHWVCVPLIMFSLLGLISTLPFFWPKQWFFNWASILVVAALLFYLRLSFAIFLGFVFIGATILYGISFLDMLPVPVWTSSLILFAGAWVGQFYGHKIEGKKPSFLQDIKFLLIGPAWLLHFIYKKFNIPY